ncbi:MAG: ABC transporter permease [Candidatus Latescibacterota bacterium]
MTWLIVRKEIHANLLSARFALGLVITVAMMGTVGYVLLQDHVARRQSYISDVQRHRRELAECKVFSRVAVTVDIPPSPLALFGRPSDEWPTAFTVSPYAVPSLLAVGGGKGAIGVWGTSSRPENPLLRFFSAIDLAFVVGLVLSLFAGLLVFDAFSGEREGGTLPLLLSGNAGRGQVLAGKLLGAYLTLALPLTLGFLVVLLLWGLSGDVTLDGEVWAGTGVLYAVSLLYLAGFLALGLLLSLCVRDSSAGLMSFLLLWILVTVVVPQGGSYLAQRFRSPASRAQLTADAEQARRRLHEAQSAIPYQQKCGWWWASTDDTGGHSLLGITEEEVHNRVEYNKKAFPLVFAYAEEMQRIRESYERRLRAWQQRRDALLRLSPARLYRNVVQATAGAEVASLEASLRTAREYRQALMDYLLPRVGRPEWVTRALEHPEMQPTEANTRLWRERAAREGDQVYEEILDWDRVAPLDLSAMPQPAVRFPGLGERLSHVWLDLLLLVAVAAGLVGAAGWRVQRYEVR